MSPGYSNTPTVENGHLENAISHLSKKWSVSVVRTLFDEGAMGFSALQDRLDGISGKVLADCLETLQEHRIVERRVLQEEPLRVEYRLTGRGEDLEPVVASLEAWTADHLVADTPTVLLADDDRRLVEMHESWLSPDYEVRTAVDGEEARELLDEDVDVLVSDRRMAGLSGEQLAQYAQLSDLDCVVVFLSSVDVDESLLDVHFDDYVRKPSTPDRLSAVIEQWLGLSAERDRCREYESICTRLSLFEAHIDRARLRDDDAYQRLRERAAVLDQELPDEQPPERAPTETNERPV